MAIFTKILVATTLLSAITTAIPLVPRFYFTVTDVITKTEWKTLDVTETEWVNDATASHGPPPPVVVASTKTQGPNPANTISVMMPAPAPAETSTTTSSVDEAPATTSTLTSIYQAPSVSPTMAAITTSAAPIPTTTYAQATVSAGALAQAQTGVTGSATASCEGTADACAGDVTHWDGGLGACGTVVDTNADYAIALPFEFMGTLSNTNPYCGRLVTLYNPNSGTTVQATVRDKCMGCMDRAIDCTDVLFNAITDNLGNGRYPGIVWWLN